MPGGQVLSAAVRFTEFVPALCDEVLRHLTPESLVVMYSIREDDGGLHLVRKRQTLDQILINEGPHGVL